MGQLSSLQGFESLPQGAGPNSNWEILESLDSVIRFLRQHRFGRCRHAAHSPERYFDFVLAGLLSSRCSSLLVQFEARRTEPKKIVVGHSYITKIRYDFYLRISPCKVIQ